MMDGDAQLFYGIAAKGASAAGAAAAAAAGFSRHVERQMKCDTLCRPRNKSRARDRR